jgi:hypothetical protein
MGRASLATIAVVVAAAAAGCASSKPSVQLAGGTEAAGGKALVLAASTDEKLVTERGGRHVVELRAIDADSEGASFDDPQYVDKHQCVVKPCEWTVVPAKAGTYEFKAFLVDFKSSETAGESDAMNLTWSAPPKPDAIQLYVNGKTPPATPLGEDEYTEFPQGPMQVEARWTTDATDTGYYLKISVGAREYARCSTGTSCRVPEAVPLAADQELSWKVELLTTKGDKLVNGFNVCLEGAADSKTS